MRTRSLSAAFFRFVFLIVDVISDAKDGHLLNPLWFMNSQMRPIHAQLHAQDGAMAAMKAARMEMMISGFLISYLLSRRLCPDGTKGSVGMARIARIKAEGEAFYHVVSRIAGRHLKGVLPDTEKRGTIFPLPPR